jgi:hypothetical protein
MENRYPTARMLRVTNCVLRCVIPRNTQHYKVSLWDVTGCTGDPNPSEGGQWNRTQGETDPKTGAVMPWIETALGVCYNGSTPAGWFTAACRLAAFGCNIT